MFLKCYIHNNQNVTPYGQKVVNHLIPEIIDQLAEKSKYYQRKKEIEYFNKHLARPYRWPYEGKTLKKMSKLKAEIEKDTMHQVKELVISLKLPPVPIYIRVK